LFFCMVVIFCIVMLCWAANSRIPAVPFVPWPNTLGNVNQAAREDGFGQSAGRTMVLCPQLVVPRDSECTMLVPAFAQKPGVLPVTDKSGKQLIDIWVPMDFRTSVGINNAGALSPVVPRRDRKITLATKRGDVLAYALTLSFQRSSASVEGHEPAEYLIYTGSGKFSGTLSHDLLTSYTLRTAGNARVFIFVGNVGQLALNVFDSDSVVIAATRSTSEECDPAPLNAQIRVAAEHDVGLLLLAFACILDLQRETWKA